MNINKLFAYLENNTIEFGLDNFLIKVKSNVYLITVDNESMQYSKTELHYYLQNNRELFNDIDLVVSKSNTDFTDTFFSGNFKPDAIPDQDVTKLLLILENNKPFDLINDSSIIKIDTDNYLAVINDTVNKYSRSELINVLMENKALLHGIKLKRELITTLDFNKDEYKGIYSDNAIDRVLAASKQLNDYLKACKARLSY